jgi:hypothetical protein
MVERPERRPALLLLVVGSVLVLIGWRLRNQIERQRTNHQEPLQGQRELSANSLSS